MARRFVCSACGFSRGAPEPVVEHIDRRHAPDEARIMEHDAAVTRLGALYRRVRRVFERPGAKR